jgi:hypothetical protein
MNGPKLIIIFFLLSGWVSAETNTSIFESKIKAVLAEKCSACHSGNDPKSDFPVDSYPALLAGEKTPTNWLFIDLASPLMTDTQQRK